MKHLDLFSGIGGFALAARQVGWETVAFCEIDPYCQKVLAKHWPGVPIHTDVTELDGSTYRGAVDIITGGFPCQDLSVAGKQAGIEGSRSGLWSELARLIGEVRPRFAVVENVPMLLAGERGGWFQRVLGDLAEIGLDAEWHCIPASAVGAPHQRDRVWVIADSIRTGSGGDRPGEHRGRAQAEQQGLSEVERETRTNHAESLREALADASWNEQGREEQRPERERAGESGESESITNTSSKGLEGRGLSLRIREALPGAGGARWWQSEPDVGRVAHGVPSRVDRLKGLGNAVVPAVPEIIFRAIDSV